ncbi:uncharacterized protein LOC17883248 [Capsella rubella]|uniref:uncharacterized protein LOC17883248 n=1 Tax=Capsella rubella TaxID=81985 RepID=UPI000CD4A409|nr:uncharacterized protein LOC17883248 [Capsella rubella]
METSSNLICHGHPLTPSPGFALRCYWCKAGGYISNGYRCTECDRWFHKDCVNSKFPKIFYHTSHPQHLLMHTDIVKYSTVSCHVCRLPIYDDWTYHCFMCKTFSSHLPCAIEAPRLTIEHPQRHKHPLVFFPISGNPTNLCEVCKENIVVESAYRCFKCKVVLHVECENLPEVNHPCHPKHSLKIYISGTLDYIDNSCLLCGFKFESVLYHCSICNFSVCLGCTSIPPPVNVERIKTHEHKLTLMARQISFTCNACGMQGDRSPYFCFHCGFMVHRSCIGLPRVISINRHDHRIYHTENQKFSFEDSVCKVCLQSINRFYGAYSCLVCINYVVHSKCATRNDIWDGIELEGVPEETEDIMSFKEVGDNMINHFSHRRHNLKLSKDLTTLGGIVSIRCEACMRKTSSEKHHMSHDKPFTLHVRDVDLHKIKICNVCGEMFNGFRNVEFVTDCSDLVKMVSSPTDWPAFSVYLDDITTDREEFSSFSLSLVPRNLNVKADYLARQARSTPQLVKYVNNCPSHWLV